MTQRSMTNNLFYINIKTADDFFLNIKAKYFKTHYNKLNKNFHTLKKK